jgi:mono/diheme cytochrome c family protein
MIRNLALALAAIVIIGAGFVITFFMWNQADGAKAFSMGVPLTEFNMKTAHALERGCNACHGDKLEAAVNRLLTARETPKPKLHGIFRAGYDVPMRVEDCMPCHNIKSTLAFAGSIHSLHLHSAGFNNMGGTCDSCHGTTLRGKRMLWDDENRYQVLNGIKYNRTPEFSRTTAGDPVRELEKAAKAN